MGQQGNSGVVDAARPSRAGGRSDTSGDCTDTTPSAGKRADSHQSGSSEPKLGGYKDKPWLLRFWEGITFYPWLRLLVRNRFRVAPARLLMAIFLLGIGVFNLVLAIVQLVVWGRRITRTKIDRHPIFILGHWRAGTTWLHELMVLDPRHTFPDTYTCFAPNHCLVSRGWLSRMISVFMPTLRPMDNMPAGWDKPQEDEFALCNMGLPSPYLTIAFPNEPPQYPEYLTLRSLPPAALGRWKRAFVRFLQCVTLARPGADRAQVAAAHLPGQDATGTVSRRPVRPHRPRPDGGLRLDGESLEAALPRPGAPAAALPGPGRARLRTRSCGCTRRSSRIGRWSPRAASAKSATRTWWPIPSPRCGGSTRSWTSANSSRPCPALEKYVEGRADYQRNRYEIPPETRAEIVRRWGGFMRKYGYGEK